MSVRPEGPTRDHLYDGRLNVDTDMRVLRRSASSATIDDHYRPATQNEIFSQPILGLYAAGVDVGNVHHRTYLGGMCQEFAIDRIAGRNAATFASN